VAHAGAAAGASPVEMPPPSQQLRRRPPASGAHGRRHAALAALSAPAVAWAPPAPARAAAAAAPAAKIGYQLKLPDKWEQVQGRGAPKLDDATARTLLVARLDVAQLEALVTRIPLAVSQRDPQGADAPRPAARPQNSKKSGVMIRVMRICGSGKPGKQYGKMNF
ncbi:unnamed protein product, partial [Prorocentrum cordatum]